MDTTKKAETEDSIKQTRKHGTHTPEIAPRNPSQPKERDVRKRENERKKQWNTKGDRYGNTKGLKIPIDHCICPH